MRGYNVYSEATAGEELLCESEPRNTKDSNCCACGKIFRMFNLRSLTSSAKPLKFPHSEINCNYSTSITITDTNTWVLNQYHSSDTSDACIGGILWHSSVL